MKTFAPEYYSRFRCIAGDCRHSCCLKWEVDIDEESVEKYLNVPGEFGERLKKNIIYDENSDLPHFRMTDERCEFLNDRNLCDIFTELGEDSLCQICTDHPRFRNFFTGRTEIGLGLACEEAGRIILSSKEEFNLKEISDDGEQEEEDFFETDLLELRNDLFDILKNRKKSTDDRIIEMLRFCDFDASGIIYEEGSADDMACEQLACYLLYRNMADAIYDNRLEERIMFVAESYMKIRNIWTKSTDKSLSFMVETARQFSEEVEYNTETWGF